MTDRVVQRLLHDSIKGKLDARGRAVAQLSEDGDFDGRTSRDALREEAQRLPEPEVVENRVRLLLRPRGELLHVVGDLAETLHDGVAIAHRDRAREVRRLLLEDVREFPEQLGRHLAEFALRRLQQPDVRPQQLTIPTLLVERDSTRTRAPRPSAQARSRAVLAPEA